MRDTVLALEDAFCLSSVVECLWASLCSGGTRVVEGIGRAVCMVRLQGVTVLQSPELKASTVVGASSGIVTHPVWHLAGLLMGRVTLAGTWQVSALLCYLSLMLQNHQAWLSSAVGASESSTLKQA